MIRVERVPAGVTFRLRREVLRPHETYAELVLPGDDDPETGHFAAFDDEDRVVGTSTVRREAPPWDAAHTSAWRLRGMATADGLRGQGIGAQVLAATIDHVAREGGGLLWCNARTPAIEFYRRAGFETRGEVWEEPKIGPHIVMLRWVDPQRQ